MNRRDRRAAESAAAEASIAAQQAQEQPVLEAEPQVEIEAREAPKPRNEPRRLAMEEIAARHERTSGNATTEEPEPPKAVETPPEPTPETPAPVVVETPPEPPPAVEMVTVKIDGVESQVSKADVEEYGGLKAYQLTKAAENRLTKANETVAESKRAQAMIMQWAQQQAAPKQPQMSDDEFIASRTEMIRMGTPEEANAAMREMLQRGKVDPNAITQMAVHEIKKQQAGDIFAKEFQDIVTNQVLMDAAIALENRLPRQNQDLVAHLRNIGNQVRSAFGRQSQPVIAAVPSTSPDQTSQGDREARKASIVNLPTAAAARAAPPAEEKVQSREEVLADMKKLRGIQTG